MEEKIKNRASIELELCDKTIEIASEEIEITPIKLKITKTQDCDFVVIGERIKYTVFIENECGGAVYGLKFKDELDQCLEYVEGSFRVGEEHKTPEIMEGILTYEIEEIGSCETLEISFEVIATESCCRGCRPDPERSTAPTIRPMIPLNPAMSGTGVSGATVFVEFPNGEIRQVMVYAGNWGIIAPTLPRSGDVIKAWQIEPGKEESDIVTITVGR